MRRLLFVWFLFFMVSTVCAASLQWDYPADWEHIGGWMLHYEADGENFNLSVPKGDFEHISGIASLRNIHDKLNLHFGMLYTLWFTAYNDQVGGGTSNVIFWRVDGD